MRLSPRYLLPFLALGAVGCGSDSAKPTAPASTPDVFEMELFDSTIELGPDDLSSLTSEDPDLTLHFSPAPASLDAVDRGSVLIGGTSDVVPSGLLRLVTSVDRTGSDLAVHTIRTLPQLAFKHLRVQATRTIDPDAAHPDLKPLAGDSSFPSKKLDEFVFNGDHDPATTDDQVHLVGNLSAGLVYTFGLSADWSDVTGSVGEAIGCALSFFSSCDPLEILPEITGGFSFGAGADAELHLDGSAFLGFSKEITLPPVKFDKIVFGPLVFFPELEVRADLEGDASGEFSVGVSATAHAGGGLSYSSRHGGSASAPSIDTPEFKVLGAVPGLGARAKARVGPRLSVKLYDVLGPFASLYAFAELKADRTQTPCYTLTAGIEGDVGIVLAFEEGGLSLGLPPFVKPFGVTSSTISQGECPLPPGGEPGGPADVLANPTFTPWSSTYGDTLLYFPPEDAGAQVEWTDIQPSIDGRYTVVGTAMDSLLKVDEAGSLLWAKQYSLPVAWNDSVSQKEILPSRLVPTLDGGSLFAAFPYTLAKVDDQGSLLWAEQIDWPYRESMLRPTGLARLPDGTYLASGNVATDRAATFDQMDTFLTHLDDKGALLSTKKIGDAGFGEIARALVPFADGAMLVGSTYDPTRAFWRGTLTRLDSTGQILWAKTLDAQEGGSEIRTFLLTGYETKEGDFVAAGTADVGSRESTLVLKAKPDGTIAWATVQDVPDSYVGVTLTGIAPLPTTGMVAAGRFSVKWASDLWLAGLDSIGKIQWFRRFGFAGGGGAQGTDPSGHNAPGVAVTRDGGVLVAGYTEGLATGQTTSGVAIFDAFAKDGTLNLSDPRATYQTAAAAVDAVVTVSGTAWNPGVTDLDAPVSSVELTVTALNAGVTKLAP